MKNYYSLLAFLLLVFSSFFNSEIKAESPELCEGETVNYILECPPDVTVGCDAELWDLYQYGDANYWDGWDWYYAGEPTVTYNLNMCNVGTITRTWTIEDPYWNLLTCTQTITVVGAGGFNGYSIDWPDDITLTGCNPNTHPSALPAASGYPSWGYADCTMLGSSYTDEVYVVNANCRKILRTWTVMDWCSEDWYGNPTGVWTHVQKIKIMNNEVPYVQCPDDIHASSSNCQNAEVIVPPLYVNSTSCGGDFTIINNSPYAYNNGANISGVYPIGWTTVKYTIKYGCGLKKYCTVKVHVTNDAGPTPYCYGSLAIVLMGIDNDGDGVNDEGMAELWAKDIDKGSTGACGNSGHLKFSFSSDPTDDVKYFTCDDVGINYVDMWVTDYNGNQSYCTVRISVQNNAANIQNCEPDDEPDGDDNPYHGDQLYDIKGWVKYLNGTAAPGVRIDLTEGTTDTTYVTNYLDTTEVITLDSFLNDQGEYDFIVTIDTVYTTEVDTIINTFHMTDYSGENGRYLFDSVGVDSTLYTLTATLDSVFVSDYNDGSVNAADLQYLMDYLIGDRTFRNNAERLAADIDGDGDIDFDDLKLLYNFVVGNIDGLPENGWRVVAQEKLDSDADVLGDEALNVIRRRVNSTHVTNGHFRVIKVADIATGSSGLVQAVGYNGEAAPLAFIEEVNTVEELKIEMRAQRKGISEVIASPNPFSEVLTIEYKTERLGNDAVLEIYNAEGRIVRKQGFRITSNATILNPDMSALNSGLYIYKIIDGKDVHTGRLLKI